MLVGYNVSTVWSVPKSYQDHEGAVRDLVKRLNIEDKVSFWGFRDDIASIMKAIDIYAHSAILPEPFGRVIVEAMCAGAPVIAPCSGGIPEIVEDGISGYLYPVGDVEALKNKLIVLSLDKNMRLSMSELGGKVVFRKFSAENYARQVEMVYSELLDD